MTNTSNTPKLSNRARKALDVLADGGRIRHGLERNSYTGREHFHYRLQKGGYNVRGFGLATFSELESAGMLTRDGKPTSVSTYYKLRTEG